MDAEFAKDDRKRLRTAKSCGPDAPMAGVKLLRSSRFLGATVTNKLWSRRGEHGISRKPLRREGRTASAEPVCSCAFLLHMHWHMRPRVQRAPGLPCALCFWGERICKTRAQRAARTLMFAIVRLDRTIQYSEALTMESRTRGVLDARLRGHDRWTQLRDLATAFARVLLNSFAPKRRGRREDRVHAAPAVPCAKVE